MRFFANFSGIVTYLADCITVVEFIYGLYEIVHKRMCSKTDSVECDLKNCVLPHIVI